MRVRLPVLVAALLALSFGGGCPGLAERLGTTEPAAPAQAPGATSRLAGTAAAAGSPAEEDPGYASTAESDAHVLLALKAEMDRSLGRLKIDRFPPPYFIQYTLREEEEYRAEARFGGIVSDSHGIERKLYVRTRVGDYDFDNSQNDLPDPFYDAGIDYMDLARNLSGPLDDNPTALRSILWLLTDFRYKEALAQFAAKQGRKVYTVEKAEDKAPDFSREKPVEHRSDPEPFEVDWEGWKEKLRRETERLRKVEGIARGSLTASFSRLRRTILTNEGTSIVTEDRYFALAAEAAKRAPDGMPVSSARYFYARTVEELPSDAELRSEIDAMAREAVALAAAPVLEPFTGPAILDPSGTGTFFHEAIGHRLEGERLLGDKSGQTFRNKIGEKILPGFLSIEDDPTLRTAAGRSLFGAYDFDDEGVPAGKAVLVVDGVLRGYLLSRAPVPGFPSSNGHGRSDGSVDPIARMANLVVRSAHPLPIADLKRALREETRRQGKPFGLIIRRVSSGETNTRKKSFQAFRAIPKLVYRVDPETGEETLVRGVEFVGTPLLAITKMIAAGDDTDVENGYCGAESGYVPVSSIAPSTLVSEIEMQKTTQKSQRPPILPPP